MGFPNFTMQCYPTLTLPAIGKMLYFKLDHIAHCCNAMTIPGAGLKHSFILVKLVFIGILFVIGTELSGCKPEQSHREPSAIQQGNRVSSEVPMTIHTDTSFLMELFDAAAPVAETHPDSAILIYQQILRLSKTTDHFNYTAAAYANLAYCFKKKQDFQQADAYLKMGMVFVQNVLAHPGPQQDPAMQRKLYEKLMQFYHWLAQPDQMISNFKKAKPLYLLTDPAQLNAYTDVVLRVGSAYINRGDYDSALSLYYELLPHLSPVTEKNYEDLFYVYSGLAASSGRLFKPRQVSQFYQHAESIAKKFQDSSLLMMLYTNMGTYFLEKGDLDSATAYAMHALHISNTMASKNPSKLFGWFSNSYTISAALMQNGRAEEALPYSQLLLKSALQQHDKNQTVQGYYILGSNYLRLDQYQEAIEALEKGLEQAKDIQNHEYVSSISGQLGIAYAGLGNYKRAYIHKSNYITLKDSFRSKENAASFDELNTKYQILQKDKVLAEKQVSIERQQKLNYIWAGSTLLLALLLIGLIWRRRQKLTIEKLKASLAGEEKERERIAQELHDGIVSKLSVIKTRFSALPSGSPAHEEAYQDVVSQLDQSIREIRSTSHNLLPEPLRHADLEQILQLYCERINSISPLDVTLQVLDTLPPFTDEFKLNIYRIIQELIQNMLKHADATTVLIQFSIDEGLLELTLEDNGSPAEWENQASGTGKGSGLQNLRNRIRLLHGRMEVEHHAGTSVYLYFPLKPHLKKG